MIPRIPLASRHLFRAIVSSRRNAGSHSSGGHKDPSHYQNPYAIWHPAGVELIPAHHSPDPWTLDPEKIAKDPYHTLHGVPQEFWPGRLDEVPLPTEPWDEHYRSIQRRYNMQLGAAILFFLTAATVFVSNPKIFWHTAPLDITDLNWREEE